MKNETYEEFVKKFTNPDIPKTTDDCYTPKEVMDVVNEYVANRYHLDSQNFVRPFYPGGDYEHEEYTEDNVVVDNPPFSILSPIVKFYQEHGIKFFLFCPQLTITFVAMKTGCSVISVGNNITYNNGAKVNTAFITNLEKKQCFFYDKKLSKICDKKKTKKLVKPWFVISSIDVQTHKITKPLNLKDFEPCNSFRDKDGKRQGCFGGAIKPKTIWAKIRVVLLKLKWKLEADLTLT